MALEAVLWDFNGVIVDDEPLHRELFYRVVREAGIDLLPDARFDVELIGRRDRDCLTALLAARRGGVDAALVDALIARKAAYYAEAIASRARVFPGVEALVRAAGARWRLALVSGALRREVEASLAVAGLREAFDVLVAAEDVTRGKPDPEGFRLALERLNRLGPVHPAECLVIEDSLAGVEAAKRAGMTVLAVANSYPAEALGRQADRVVPTLEGLGVADLEAILGGRGGQADGRGADGQWRAT